MKAFVTLYEALDETNSSNRKIELIQEYLQNATAKDAVWAVYFLSGRRFKRFLSGKNIRKWVRELLNHPRWLFSEVMAAVGDTAEAIALLVDTAGFTENTPAIHYSLSYMIEQIQGLQYLDEDGQFNQIREWWQSFSHSEVLVLNKLLTGAFRVGVSRKTVVNAISIQYNLSSTLIQRRMMGNWDPTPIFFEQLTSQQPMEADISAPYPFFLASPLQDPLDSLGDLTEWCVEYKWDGIRCQLVIREGKIFLWSRGEDLINRSFPEIVKEAFKLPDGVYDAELLAYHKQPLAFSVLQRRIGREDVNDVILEEAPVTLMVYDLLEIQGQDMRSEPLSHRRNLLEEVFTNHETFFLLSSLLQFSSWYEVENARVQAREQLAEGLMLKRLTSSYQAGRPRGDWFKAKVNPLTIDAVLIYAQTGTGRRANLFTAYTFALRDENNELVPVGRAYSGLTDDEIRELDRWIRGNTDDRFGPVRSVSPEQVFELGFDGIMSNDRVKSGVSLRFPRMLRWRRDKTVADIDTVTDIREYLKYEGITEVQTNRSLDDFF